MDINGYAECFFIIISIYCFSDKFFIKAKMPIFILIVAFIYLVESLSDIIQVGWFKYTKKKYGEGRRVFKMAPLHHHFQESGYAETQVVAAFATVTAILCLVAYLAL